MHKIWLGVKNLISLKSTKSQNPISISIGNSVSSDPEIVANSFNDFSSSIIYLINIVERIRKSLDKDELACGVFVDLQKAFDSVDHSILLSYWRML